MTRVVDSDFELGIGSTLRFSQVVSGFLLRSGGPGQQSPHLTIAGTVTHTTDFNFLSVLFDHEPGGAFHGGLIEITESGSASVTAAGIGTALGYFASGYGSAFVNRGSLTVDALQQAFGLFTYGVDFNVMNSGVLRIRSQTLDAIGIQAMNGVALTNSGLLDVTGVRVALGILVERGGTIDNSGTVVVRGAEDNVGILVRHSENEITDIVNSGTIEADIAILDESAAYSPPQRAAQNVENSGTIRGLIDLRLGDDVVTNTGLIEGDVLLGYGADTYVGTGGAIRGAVHGGFGADRLTGGADDDALFGEEGDDVIRGEGGDDLIQGGRGANRIDGGAGRDTLTYSGVLSGVEVDLREGRARGGSSDEIAEIEDVLGSDFADTLLGDDHDNLLFGADGNDILDGRAGSDVVAGGVGDDTLTGGAGDDVFVFGSGDGHDQITDFAPGDRIQIHGYASALSIEQVGADTVIRLSATDSLTLRGVDAGTLAAGQVTFAPEPRPSFEPGLRPDGLGRDGFTVYETMTLLADEDVDLDGVGSIRVMGHETEPLQLINGGNIRVASAAPVVAPAVFLVSYGRGPSLENRASGLISVTTENAEAYAYGVYANTFDVLVTNYGRIEVTSAGHGAAVWGGNSALRVENHGAIAVAAEGDAFGVNLGSNGGMHNSGSIDVRGGGQNTVGIRVITGNDISNAGTIDVSSDRGTGVGIYMRSDAYDIHNSGRITADIAIDAAGYFSGVRGVLTNSGEIFGEIRLGGAPDRVVNSGLLDGVVHLGYGDDRFDGSAGVQRDEIHGGFGQDRLIGGSGVDLLFGDEGSDTLEGGLGDDVLNGGSGDDFAVFAGNRSDYQWSVNGNVITITGPEGTDTLVDVELLRFADELVSLTGVGVRVMGLGGDDVLHGSELADVLDGGEVPPLVAANGSDHNGHDQLFGYGGDDVLIGGGQNDLLVGGEGDDTIIGGTGYDVSGYAGARKGYATVNSTTVAGGREGGTDTLTGIEAAAFVDGLTTFNPDSQAAQLMRLYSAAFDRAPDAEGFHVQLDALEGGVSMAEMARRFLTSDEFVSRFGTLTDVQYVQRLYQNAFDRQPSNAEINDWLAYLNAGNTRQALMLVIAESAESRTATWSTLSAGLWVGDAVTESLARLFDTVFDRLPDENGLVTWRASMAGGATLLDVATAFLASAEGQARYGGLSNAQFVEAVYQAALNRAADAGGLAAYTAGLNAGTITRAQMLAEVSESAEHRALYLPNLVGGVSLQAAAPAPVETGAKIVHDEAGPQVLPGLDDDGKDDGAGPQTVPADPEASGSRDAGPQILPGLEADAGSKEDGAQVLPGLPDDAAVSAKDAGPQVLPGLDDDAFLPMPAADAGRAWAGLSARLDGDVARELPVFAADDFLPVTPKDAGPQILPAETGLDLEALFAASPAELALEGALAALTPDPLKPAALDVEDSWHQLPTHDAFQ